MPELPEVETALRGVAPYLSGKTFSQVIVRNGRLRQPVPDNLQLKLVGEKVLSATRRAKYLLLHTAQGIVLIHLGMSGNLRVFTAENVPEAGKHDHVDFVFHDGIVLRYRDPRRFGLITFFAGAPEYQPLLSHLGPEPLESGFDAAYLFSHLQKQNRSIKAALTDNRLVVGIGNIYASESLFQAALLPTRIARTLSENECSRLVAAVKDVLTRAIAAGGSTLRDFVGTDGKNGYFPQYYAVYGRTGETCRQCGSPISKTVQGGRSSFYCPVCQH